MQSHVDCIIHRPVCDKSISPVILGFFGIGVMVERLKQERTSHISRYLLKICEKMGASWSAQVFRQAGVFSSF